MSDDKPSKPSRTQRRAPEPDAAQRLAEIRAENERLHAELARVKLTPRVGAVAAPPMHRSVAPVAPGELARTFGDNLRLARTELRLSQRELAQLSGISQKHISLIEQGGNATLATIEALAPHVDRTALELLTPRLRRR